MNILHIVSHLGDGGGKAVGGLARLGNRSGEHTHRILLLDKPMKLNHIERCKEAGVEILEREQSASAIANADVVVVNWWSGGVMEAFLREFPDIECRVLLWSHKNGYHDPPLPNSYVDTCDALLATSPWTLENPRWCEKGTLVWGCGDFEPASIQPKTDYSLKDGRFVVGYIGSPSYKKLPRDYLDYCEAVIKRIPNVHFILVGETSDEFKNDVANRNIDKHFAFPGWVSDVEALLRNFDVFGYLLSEETFATTENAVLEAMAAALPTVVSRRPLGQFLLEDEKSGFLGSSPDEYVKIMEGLYKDESLRIRVGQEAREYVLRTYRADENLANFHRVCEKVIEIPKKIVNFKERKND